MADEQSIADLYSAEHIKVLRTREHIRLNPGMYIGNVEQSGLHYLLFALIRSCLAEARKGRGRCIRITLHRDGSAEVSDDGSAVPPDLQGRPTFEEALVPHTGKSPNDRHWLDYAVAAALSEWLQAESRSVEGVFRLEMGLGGEIISPPSRVGPADGSGLTVRFLPDRSLFGDARFDAGLIRDRLHTHAFLHSGITFILTDQATGTVDTFVFNDGLRNCVEWLDIKRTPIHPEVLLIQGQDQRLRFEAALRWCQEDEEIVSLFANGERLLGGSHVTGMRAAVTRSLNTFIRDHLPAAGDLAGLQTRAGLTAVLALWGNSLDYEGATRTYVSGSAPRRLVEVELGRSLRSYFQQHPETAEKIVRAAVARMDGPPMTQAEWVTSDDPRRMLRFLNLAAASRKLRLFLAECVRRSTRGIYPEDELELFAGAVEQFADFKLPAEQLRLMNSPHGVAPGCLAIGVASPTFSTDTATWLASMFAPSDGSLNRMQCELLREVFGNPFHSFESVETWRTSTAVSLARQMYDSRDFSTMPILADALEDAGCENEALLDHCRSVRNHIRGCWALDLLLTDPH